MGQEQHGNGEFDRVKAALRELAAHTVVIIVLLGAFWLVEKWLQLLWGAHERLLVGRVPLQYFFDLADAIVHALQTFSDERGIDVMEEVVDVLHRKLEILEPQFEGQTGV